MKNISASLIGGQRKNADKTGKSRMNGISCFVIADGEGTHGELASDAIISTILEYFGKKPEVSCEAIKAYFDMAHEVLGQLSAMEKKELSASAVALITDGKKAVWGHIGNCRLYRFENGALEEITNDHTKAFVDFYSGRITFDEMRMSEGRRELLRDFANFNSYRPEFSKVIDVKANTAFLLCSDGFWEYIDEEDMQWAHYHNEELKNWVDDMLVHIDSVTDKHCDNISVLAVNMK